MYNQQQTKELQKSTANLLQAISSSQQQPANQIDLLREALRFHEYRYYVQADPLISDYEYDMLYKSLEKFEADNPASITIDSPTQRVGKGLIKDFPKKQHLVPMLSLQNSYSQEDLLDWDRKAKALTGLAVVEYCAEPKFDGASISLIYENDLLIRAVTRGDGIIGDEITTNVKQIKSVPLSAKFSKYGILQIEIRGEVLMNKKNFKAFNDKLIEEGIPPLANPRNAAAGTLRMKDTAAVSKKNLEAFLYHVSYIATTDNQRPTTDKSQTSNFKPQASDLKLPTTHSGMLEMLWQLGFRSPQKELQVIKDISHVIKHVNESETQRDELPYEIDGMVIKVNNLLLQEVMGMTSHHPRWAIAYKFKARQATSQLINVTFQVGRTGAVTPVAKITPVQVAGVTVSSISIHNKDFIEEKNLMLGDTVLIERSGDVIPQIVKSFPELRTGTEQVISFPTCCPVCNHQLFKPEEEAVWRCININCKAQVVERIIHFVSKDAMDIRSLGEANVKKFYDMGFLKNITSIYALPYDELAKLEGFGNKSIANLQIAIENSKQQPLHRIIYGLGIRYVGVTTAKVLATAVKHLLDFASYTEEQLQLLEDVGVKVAKSIFQFFNDKENISLLQQLEHIGVQLKNDKKKVVNEGDLAGQAFLFTGTLNQLKRSEAEALVEKKGGKILGSVSSKLNYLVVGDDAGGKLEKAKKITSIKIISEEDFIQMLSG
ncbi:MAG: NAD-dependent DNA ligase LigA [Chitinophagaceae bacterium]|nr:NAD-dependent DNA ligase LigA [Chitinophagaceae bacterium]